MKKKNLLKIQSSLLLLLSITTLVVLFSSCGVSKSEHFSLKRSYEKLQSNNDYLQKKYDACEAENREMEKALKGGEVQSMFVYENIKIELLKCIQTKEIITCELLYTSKREDDQKFSISSSKAYNNGNEYKSQEINIGNKRLVQRSTYKLPFNTSVKGSITLGKFDKKISKLELLTMKSYLNINEPIEFKNIPIKQSKS